MRKVMLVIDEIQRLHGLETFLRRLGFDVLSLGKDSLVPDAILSFVPEVVIASERGRHVDGVKLAQRLKKSVVPSPTVALCFSGAAPILSASDLKSIDALLEIPLAGEAGLRLLAQLSAVAVDPLIEKFRKLSSAKLTTDEQFVVITGSPSVPTRSISLGEGVDSGGWDPQTAAGRSAEIRSERSDRYDRFLESSAKDLEDGAAERVMPRDQSRVAMAKLKKSSEIEKEELDRIQAEKIKFVETMFEEGKDKEKT